MSSGFIIELWDSLKPFINVKERQQAADAMVAIFDEYGHGDGIEHELGLEKSLQEAIIAHYELEEDKEEEDDEEY
jgi:hypothetical protein